VLVGEYAGSFEANSEQASALCYVPVDALKVQMLTAPERYAVWFFTALGMAEVFRTAALRIPPAE
jgi:hypothetical protein